MRKNLRRNFWSGDLKVLKQQVLESFSRTYKSTENISPTGNIFRVQTQKPNEVGLFCTRDHLHIKPVFKSQHSLSKVVKKNVFSVKVKKTVFVKSDIKGLKVLDKTFFNRNINFLEVFYSLIL